MPVASGSAVAALMNACTDATTPGVLQAAADLGDAVALLDLEDDLAPAGAGVVLRVGELVAEQVDALGHARSRGRRRRPPGPTSTGRGSPGMLRRLLASASARRS